MLSPLQLLSSKTTPPPPLRRSNPTRTNYTPGAELLRRRKQAPRQPRPAYRYQPDAETQGVTGESTDQRPAHAMNGKYVTVVVKIQRKWAASDSMLEGMLRSSPE